MKAPAATPALTNPFPHARAERHGLYFASVHSYVIPFTGWHGPRKHLFWVLDVASDWPIRIRVGSHEIVRPPHSVALYAPNVDYGEFLEKGNLMRQAWLMFRVADPRSPLRRLVKPGGYRLFEDPGVRVRPLIDQIASYFLHPDPGADWFIQSAFYQVLALLRSARGEPLRRIQPPTLKFHGEEGSLRQQVEAYLRIHPREHTTAAEMAGHLRLGLSSFTHRYHEEAGETFLQTKTRLRIEEARSRLLGGEVAIKRIALELGFSDAAHFSRVFRRAVGMSPVHFARELAPRFPPQTVPQGGVR